MTKGRKADNPSQINFDKKVINSDGFTNESLNS